MGNFEEFKTSEVDLKQIRKVQVKTLDLNILKNLVLEMPWDENEKLKLKIVRDDIEV